MRTVEISYSLSGDCFVEVFPVEFILVRGRSLEVLYVHMCTEMIVTVLCMQQETGEIRYLGMEIGGLPDNVGSKSAKSFNK